MPGGRPSDYSPELADEICEYIAGGNSLKSYCDKKGNPSNSMVYRWLEAHEGFREKYARARERLAEHWAEQIVTIADDGTNDTYQLDDGSRKVEHDHIQRSRLRVDTRKWLMARMAPKKYGEFQRTELTGADGEAVKINVTVQVVSPNANEGD